MNWKIARRIVVTVVGVTVLMIGAALIFLPGPAFVVIPTGIVILASEFAWAKRLKRRLEALAPFDVEQSSHELRANTRANTDEEPQER